MVGVTAKNDALLTIILITATILVLNVVSALFTGKTVYVRHTEGGFNGRDYDHLPRHILNQQGARNPRTFHLHQIFPLKKYSYKNMRMAYKPDFVPGLAALR